MKSLVLILVLASCGMNDRIKSQLKKSDQMIENVEYQHALTEDLYLQNRAGNAETKRADKFAEIVESDRDIKSKKADAAIYFNAFEFQNFTGKEKFDRTGDREKLIESAAKEFFYRMTDYYGSVDLDAYDPATVVVGEAASYDDKIKSGFYALAAALHTTSFFQDKRSQTAGFKKVSMLSIIQEGLVAEMQNEGYVEELNQGLRSKEGVDYNKTVDEIVVSGLNKKIATQLLIARFDLLSGMALKYSTQRHPEKGLVYTFNHLNGPTQKDVLLWLQKALQLKDFLANLGIQVKHKPSVSMGLQILQLPDASVMSSNSETMYRSLVGELKKSI